MRIMKGFVSVSNLSANLINNDSMREIPLDNVHIIHLNDLDKDTNPNEKLITSNNVYRQDNFRKV